MAIPTSGTLIEAMIQGRGVDFLTADGPVHIPMRNFFRLPAEGERNPWEGYVWFSGSDDDGGNAALAAYRFAHCGR